MSIYSNVTEQDMINLRKLEQQQKEQRALKSRNRILKQTHDKKLAESLSPITEKLDETSKKLHNVNKESTQNLENVIKENNTPELAIENTPTIQPAIENTPIHQPIEDNEGSVYSVEIENTLNKMADNTGYFKTHYDQQRGWMLNKIPIKSPGGTKIQIYEDQYDLTKGIRNVLTEKTSKSIKSLNDNEKVVLRDFLSKIGYYNRKPSKGAPSGLDNYIKNELDDDVRKILDLVTKLKGRGVEKIIIPSNIIDIYTRLEVLLGLKLSGHTNTLTEASNLIDELYKLGEIQKKNNNIEMLSISLKYKYLQI